MPIQHKQTYVNDGGSTTKTNNNNGGNTTKTTSTDYQAQRQAGVTGKINQKTITPKKTNSVREQTPTEINKRSERVVNPKTVSEKPKSVQSYNDLIAEKQKKDALAVVTAHDEGRKKRIEENPDYELDLVEFVNESDKSVMSGREYKDQISAYNASMENLYNSFQQLNDTYKSDGDYNKYLAGYNELIGKYDSLKAQGDALNQYKANYNNSILEEYESNKERMNELMTYATNMRVSGGGNKADYDNAISEYLDLKARNEGIQEIYNDVKSWKESDYYTWLQENGDEKTLDEYESYLASMADDGNWDHGWFNDRARAFSSYLTNPIQGVITTAGIVTDLLGEGAGALLGSVAEDLQQNGFISDEAFDKVSTVAKNLQAFEYNNNNPVAQALRDYRARVNREIQSGNKSDFELMAGSAIDQALENYLRWNILGKLGTFSMALNTFGDSYYEDMQKGYSPIVSLLNSSVKGYITYLTENLSSERYFNLLGSMAGSQIDKLFFATLTDRLVSMVPEEVAEEGAEYILDYWADLLTYSMQPVEEKPQFVPGDLYSAMIQAGLSTTISATMGAVKGALTYENTIPQIHSAQEYAQFSAELENIKGLLKLEADVEVKAELQRFIGMAERRMAEYREMSPIADKIKLASDQPINISYEQANQAYKEAMTPDAVAMSEEQEKTDLETKEAFDALRAMSRSVLAQKGIIMDPNEYLQMNNAQRKAINALSGTFNKLEGNKIRLVFSTNAPKGGEYRTDKKTGQAYILINPNSNTLISDIFNHEVVHTLKGSPIWNDLEKIADRIAGGRKEEYKDKLRKANYKEGAINEELVAYMLQNKYSTEAFLNEIGKKDKGLIQKLYNFITDLVGNLNGSPEAETLAKQIAKAYKNVMGSPRLTYGKAMANNDVNELRRKDIGDLRTVQDIDSLYNDKGASGVFSGELDEQRGYNRLFDGYINDRLQERSDAHARNAELTVEDALKLGKDFIPLKNGVLGLKRSTISYLIREYSNRFGGNNYIAFIDPIQFIYLTAQGYENASKTKLFLQGKMIQNHLEDKLDLEKLSKNINGVVENTSKGSDGSLFLLSIEQGTDGEYVCDGHEGRHRSLSMIKNGIYKVPVLVTVGTKNDLANQNIRVYVDNIGDGYELYNDRSTVLANLVPLNSEHEQELVDIFTKGKDIDYRLNKDIDLENDTTPTKDDKGRHLTPQQREMFKNESPLFKDEKGRLMTFYHSTPNEEFFVFDKDMIGENTINFTNKLGFFFTPSKEFSERFRAYNAEGNKNSPGTTMEVYLKAENPIIFPFRAKGIDGMDGEKLDNLVIKYLYAVGAENYLDTLYETIDEYKEDGEQIKPGDLYDAFMDQAEFDAINGADLEEDRKALQKNGYDSIILYEGTEEQVTEKEGSEKPVLSYIVFEPNQIKDVTNENPTDSPDRRYNKDIDLESNKGPAEQALDELLTKKEYVDALDLLNGYNGIDNTVGDMMPTAKQVSTRYQVLRQNIEDLKETFEDDLQSLMDENDYEIDDPELWEELRGQMNDPFYLEGGPFENIADTSEIAELEIAYLKELHGLDTEEEMANLKQIRESNESYKTAKQILIDFLSQDHIIEELNLLNGYTGIRTTKGNAGGDFSKPEQTREQVLKQNIEDMIDGLDYFYERYLEQEDITPDEVDWDDVFDHLNDPYEAESTEQEKISTTPDGARLAKLETEYLKEKYGDIQMGYANKDIDLENSLKGKLDKFSDTDSEDLADLIEQADEQIVFNGSLTPAMRSALREATWEGTFVEDYSYEGITAKDINKFFRDNPLKWSALKGDNNLSFFEFQKAHPGVKFAKNGDKRWDVVMMEFAEKFPGYINPSDYVTATEFLDKVQSIRESIPEPKMQTMSRSEFDELFDRTLDEYIASHQPKIVTNPVSKKKLEAIDRQKEAFRNSVKEWIRNYDVLRRKYDLFDKKAFDDAMADVYIEGEITPQTEKELKESIIKNDFEGMFQGGKADQFIQDFIDESVKYYVLETEYNANQKYRDSIAKNANIVNQAQSRVYDVDYDRAEQAKILEQMVMADKSRDYDALYEDVQYIIDNIKDKKNILHNRDLKEYNDLVADGNEILRQKFNEVLEQPVRTAQKQELAILQEYAPKLIEIQKETGIKMYSKEDEAVGWIIEGQKQSGAKYTLEDLKKDFPKKWEQIIKLAQFLTENYQPWYDEEIEIKERMYGDIQYQNDIKTAKLENQLQSAKNILEKRTEDFKKNPNEKTQAGYAKAQKAVDTAQKKLDAQVIKNLEHTSTRKQYTPFRQNYFHHTNQVHFFENLKAFIKQFKKGKVDKARIPSELAGMTEFLKPKSTNQTYMWKQGKTNYSTSGIASFQHRLQEHANAVAFDPLINYLRNVESSFRELDADSQATNYLSWLTKYTNNLAGKSNDLDRVLREMSPDGALNILNELNARAKKNAVYGNISSALVQSGNFPVGVALMAKNGGKEAIQDLIQGTKDYYLDQRAGIKPSDMSTLLALRFFNIDVEDARWTSNLDKFGQAMTECLDKVTAEELWYCFRAQGQRLNKINPIAYADEMVDRSIQSRRPEDMPLSQQSKIVKLLAPFQVEVNNQWQVMKDLTKGSANELATVLKGSFKEGQPKASAKNTMGMVALMLTSALMNAGFEKIIKRKPLFDPLSVIFEAMNQELTDTEFVGRVLGEILGAMPGGQYLPSLLGMDEKEAEKFFGESDPSRYGVGNIGISAIAKLLTAENDDKRIKALEDLLFTYGTPGWGKQLQKFYREGQDFGYLPKFVNGEWTRDPIHYTSTGGVAFVNDPKDVFDYLTGALTGQYNTKAGQKYVDSEFKKLGIDNLTDANGNNIANSKALQIRKELENAGVWESVRDQIAKGKMTPGQAGLSEKVYKMTDDEFNDAYNSMMAKAEGIANQLREAYNWNDEQTSAYEKAVEIEADYSDGRKVTDSEALKTRKALEDAGIYEDVLEYIEKNGLNYSDVGLGKRVVNYDEDDFLKAYEKKIGK